MNYQLIYYEDYVISSIIVILSKKFKYLNNFALIHLNHNNSAMIKYYDQFYVSVLLCQDILYNYYIKDNPKDIKIAINYLKRYNNIINILYNEYLTNNDKEFILKELEISHNEFKLWNSYNYFLNYTQYNRIFNFQNLISQNKININKKKNPKISIIVYCLNYIYLKKTINSIQNQQSIDFEIILIYENITNLDLLKKNLQIYQNNSK